MGDYFCARNDKENNILSIFARERSNKTAKKLLQNTVLLLWFQN